MALVVVDMVAISLVPVDTMVYLEEDGVVEVGEAAGVVAGVEVGKVGVEVGAGTAGVGVLVPASGLVPCWPVPIMILTRGAVITCQPIQPLQW